VPAATNCLPGAGGARDLDIFSARLRWRCRFAGRLIDGKRATISSKGDYDERGRKRAAAEGLVIDFHPGRRGIAVHFRHSGFTHFVRLSFARVNKQSAEGKEKAKIKPSV
jgi:hypothetical protein